MISQDNLTQYMANTNFKKIILPSSDMFTQKDYYSVKKQEMDTAIEQLLHLDNLTNIGSVITNFQDDLNHKYKELMKADTRLNTSTIKEGTQDFTKAKRIDYETFLSYNENEMIPAPSIITNILMQHEQKSIGSKIMLYGNKNPESYFKSMLVLGAPDFMIKSKYERTSDICRVKKEVAFAVQNLFHANKYNLLGNGNAGRLGFNRDKMVKNLLNLENYTDAPTFQICADFMKKNIIIFDIAKKYFQLYITGPFDKLLTGSVDLVSHLRSLDWNMIIMYNNAYLPVFCVDTHHLFNGEYIINKLMTEYEWLNPELYVNAKCRTGIPIEPENEIRTDESQLLVHSLLSVPEREVRTSNWDSHSSVTPVVTTVEPSEAKSLPVEVMPCATHQLTLAELRPCTVYLLNDLQNMAETHGISTKKQGAKGTFKNKTKQELYDELATKLNSA
jgi:hypothetical protein